MKKTRILALLLALAMIFALTACGGSAPAAEEAAPAAEESAEEAAAPEDDGTVYEMKLSSSQVTGSWLADLFDEYAVMVDEATNGRVKVTIYHDNSLGAPADLYTMLTQGGLEMLNMGIAQAGEFPITDIVQTPFLLTTPDTAGEIMWQLLDEGKLPEFSDNMHVLTFLPTDMQMFATVDDKIESIDDFKGLKIRANSGQLITAIEALGASAVSITTTEVFLSLSQGVIDGAISSPSAMTAFTWQDVCKYLYATPICTGMNYIGMNLDVWNSLPADLQEAMDKVSREFYDMYMLMGDFAYNGGLTSDAYGAARKWVGHVPGGLAVTSTVASAMFGALCGSGSTTALVMTQVAWPEMKESKYDPGLGLGSIVGAGPLAILIPPSVPLIMYGLLSGASIGRLFMAGWMPGILLTVTLSICTIIQVKLNPAKAPMMTKASFKERLKSLAAIWPFLVLILVVMGSIWGGICTVNEAAGIGVIGSIAIIAVMRRMNFKGFLQTLKKTCSAGCAMFFMFVGIQIFNTFMSLSGIPKALAIWVGSLPLPPSLIIWVIVFLYLVLGCFLDSPPVMMLTVGLLAPVVQSLGYDLVWFGIVVAFTVAVGALTPPVGINLFVVSSRAPGVPIGTIIKGMVPYLITIILTLIIIFYVPQISLWLPNLMFG